MTEQQMKDLGEREKFMEFWFRLMDFCKRWNCRRKNRADPGKVFWVTAIFTFHTKDHKGSVISVFDWDSHTAKREFAKLSEEVIRNNYGSIKTTAHTN